MKRYKIRIDKDALQDIVDAGFWYEEQSVGLGKRFRAQVIKDINELKKNPLLFAVRFSDVFFARVNKFPFLFHYTVEADFIYVFAVFHSSRDPKIWDRRSGII
ncbi:MAG: type II toxin-antitoxin system RelE/ParE family toxin [Bacteroidia bacterium]